MTNPKFYQQIAAGLTELDQGLPVRRNHLFYLATPPNLTPPSLELGRPR